MTDSTFGIGILGAASIAKKNARGISLTRNNTGAPFCTACPASCLLSAYPLREAALWLHDGHLKYLLSMTAITMVELSSSMT